MATTTNPLVDFLVNSFSGALQTVGESKLEDILQDLHDSNLADYEAAIAGGTALIAHIEPFVVKSKTKIDDAIVAALKDAIAKSSATNSK